MKKLITIIFLLVCLSVQATNYYVKTAGNDANTGLSDAQAWATINKVNTSTFAPGDSILFNKGDTWRETLTVPSSGNSGANITFTAYGTGNKPKILGSNVETNWTQIATPANVWKSSLTFTDPYTISPWYANICFKETNGSISWGRVKKALQANLVTEYDWTWYQNHIYIYSSGDPNDDYPGVEISQRTACIELNAKNYLAFDGLELAYSGSKGAGGAGGQNDLIGLMIKNCHIHHIGIKSSSAGFGVSVWYSNMLIQNNEIHDCGRRNISLNNAVPTGKTISNIIVEGNTLYHGFHTTGVDLANQGDGTMDNIIIRRNLIYDDLTEYLDDVESYRSMGMYVNEESTGAINNVYIYNNIIRNTTYVGLNIGNTTYVYVYNNTFYGVNPNLTQLYTALVSCSFSANATFKNNAFYNNVNSGTNSAFLCMQIGENVGTIVSDCNLFYRTDATAKFVGWKGTSYTQWATYKSASGQDAHSPTPANPLFVSSSDFHLQSGSPCINSGSNQNWMVGAVDLDGAPRIIGGVVDIGAYESTNGATTNGIPWGWLLQYGLATDGSADWLDSDTDRFCNLYEYLAGTDPTNAVSRLQVLSVEWEEPNAFVMTWSSVTGKWYRLERGTNLLMNPQFDFTVRTNIHATPPLNTETDTNAAGSGPYFYCVGVE